MEDSISIEELVERAEYNRQRKDYGEAIDDIEEAMIMSKNLVEMHDIVITMYNIMCGARLLQSKGSGKDIKRIVSGHIGTLNDWADEYVVLRKKCNNILRKILLPISHRKKKVKMEEMDTLLKEYLRSIESRLDFFLNKLINEKDETVELFESMLELSGIMHPEKENQSFPYTETLDTCYYVKEYYRTLRLQLGF
jgi:hypothetical protein